MSMKNWGITIEIKKVAANRVKVLINGYTEFITIPFDKAYVMWDDKELEKYVEKELYKLM